MADSEDTIEARVTALEAKMDSSADREELALADSITNFGLSADKLATALQQVEQALKDVRALKNRTEDLDSDKASHGDLEALRLQQRREVLWMRGWIFTGTVIALGLIFATIYAFSAYAKAKEEANRKYVGATYVICQQRSEQADIVQRYLIEEEERIEADKTIPEAEKEQREEHIKGLLTAFPDVDCNTTLP